MAGLRDPDRLNAQVDRVLDARLGVYEKQLVANYRQAVDAIRLDIAKVYEKYAVNGELTLAEMTKFNRLTNLEKQIVKDVRPYLTANDSLLKKVSAVEYDEAFYRYAWTMDQQTGVALQWGVLNTDAVAAAVANPLDLISRGRLRATTISRVRTAVTQGLIRGQGFPEMMRGIRGSINGTASDAMRIVRTEGQRAQVEGQQESYDRAREKGVDVVDVWDATLDSRTRDEHGAIDGQHRGEDGFFDTAVGKVSAPLHSGVASFDINCRCRLRGEIEGFEPEFRRAQERSVVVKNGRFEIVLGDSKVVPYQTYKQWSNNLNTRGRSTP